MRGIKKDTRAFDRMCDLKESYQSISQKLALDGLNIKASTIYRYITHKETPSKSTKKAIAKVLKCAVMEIF